LSLAFSALPGLSPAKHLSSGPWTIIKTLKVNHAIVILLSNPHLGLS
jgi:hypothetical protein